MLVLSRREGECIKIGEDVYIGVVSITNNKVRIGIVAPADVKIDRLEELKVQDMNTVKTA